MKLQNRREPNHMLSRRNLIFACILMLFAVVMTGAFDVTAKALINVSPLLSPLYCPLIASENADPSQGLEFAHSDFDFPR